MRYRNLPVIKNSMKIYLIIFTLICFAPVNSMETEPNKEDIKRIMRIGFKAFGISIQDCKLEIYGAYLPECRWSGSTECIHLHEDIQRNPYLAEFAAHCIAASCQNSHHIKNILSFYLTMGIALAMTASLAACTITKWTDRIKTGDYDKQDSLFTIKFTLAVFESAAPLVYLCTSNTIPRIIDRVITHHFNASAFSLACQKLVENNNLKPLAAYYAYAKLADHEPLNQSEQTSMIEWTLKNQNLSIHTARTNHNSMKASIWKAGQCMASAEPCVPHYHAEPNLADFNTSGKLGISFINA